LVRTHFKEESMQRCRLVG